MNLLLLAPSRDVVAAAAKRLGMLRLEVDDRCIFLVEQLSGAILEIVPANGLGTGAARNVDAHVVAQFLKLPHHLGSGNRGPKCREGRNALEGNHRARGSHVPDGDIARKV